MKRVQEKVKDLVEVRVYKSLLEFFSDPPQTLSTYHFTPPTTDMMAKWLDSLSQVQTHNGMAKALAGYRGVGKSHFLATLGAIITYPELRSKISDMHVAGMAQQLKRRRYPVAYARRGTHATLLEEITDGIATSFDLKVEDLPGSLPQLLQFAAGKAADMPFVLIVDTAYDRPARVVRDDGEMLGEIANLAKKLNIFVGVALDDDIAGADGVNAAIARNFTIDYLDQDHLYRIVDTYIFPKYRQTQQVIHEIYSNFHEVLPGFQWSEQRFAALYPLHPVILETAPFIRLYAPEFAMLSFASEAGNKVLGRPANSLVGLDEVFDRVETSLRKAKDLKEAFAAYDNLNSEVISQIPVMQRLQAKLVLKGLLLLSLDGDGTTANEINAAMLIYDESDPQKAVQLIEDLLEKFAAAFPESVHRKAAAGLEIRYSLKVSSKDNLNNLLAEAAQKTPPEAVEKVLRRMGRERFSDWSMPTFEEAPNNAFTDLIINWRGSNRRGRISWNWKAGSAVTETEGVSDFLDWEVIIAGPQNKSAAVGSNAEIPPVVWQAAGLRPDEEAALCRYYVLLNDSVLQETYGEQVRAVGHTHRNAAEKIWNRIFLEEGKLLLDGTEQAFKQAAQTAQSLSDLFSEMLSPMFNSRYPQHPFFARNLGVTEVSKLISEYFSGTKQSFPEVQELAGLFAAPLGLVTAHGNSYVLNTDEEWLSLPYVHAVTELVNENQTETVALKTVYRELKKEPYGLVHESAQIVLAALVAQRNLEFVTSKGDRINRRSLDLQIIWDDVAGIALPETVLFGGEKLTAWAQLLTGDTSFTTLDELEDRDKIKEALEKWLDGWQKDKVLERFEQLPDEILTTKIWRLAVHSKKTFGAAAETIASVLDEIIVLEEGLQRVADAFSDSEKEFNTCRENFLTLKDFINGVAQREKVWSYLAVCETTQDEEIESLRGNIYAVIEEMRVSPSEILNLQLEDFWQEFHAKFSEHFNANHYTVMKSHHLQEKFDEILRSDEWWEFENLSALPIFQRSYFQQAQNLVRRLKELNCPFDVPALLENQPFCACSFRLSQANEWEIMPQKLAFIVEMGRISYRKTIAILGMTLAPILESMSETETEEFARAAAKLAEVLNSEKDIPLLNNAELMILRNAVQAISTTPFLQVSIPSENGFLSREELRYRLTEWINELPSEPVLLKV